MKHIALTLALIFGAVWLQTPGFAQQGLIATANQHPVTDYDVQQRIKMLTFLGEKDPSKLQLKPIANSIIDDYVKIDEAALDKMPATDKDTDERLTSIAKNLGTDIPGLKIKLAAEGIEFDTLKLFLNAQIALGHLIVNKYHDKPELKPDEVDRKYEAIKAEINSRVQQAESDPRRKAVQVIDLQEVNFPVDSNDPQILSSRGAEAMSVIPKINSCTNLKAATKGIFAVEMGRSIKADASKLPPPLRAAIMKRGVGHAIGPMRYPKGVQILVWCGTKTVTPPPINVQLPTRQQIETLAMSEKFAKIEEKYMALMRKSAIIEYKDPSYAR